MRLSFCTLGLLALGLGAFPACLSANGDESVEDVHGVSGPNATIAFEDTATLTLVPGQLVKVTVHTSPPAPYELAFFLKGAALDASLSATTVVAAADGTATVQLKAPNAATSFALRAKIKDGPAVDLLVSVSDKGFGSLRVKPAYDGLRDTREWVASVVSGTSCAALAPVMPSDPEGALYAVAEPGNPLLVHAVPVGPTLAVFVRGGHYMWGCADVANLAAGSTIVVDVPIVAKPIDLSATRLEVDLSFTPEPGPWSTAVGDALHVVLDTLLAPGTDDATALLAMMKELAPDPSVFFSAAEIGGWNALVANHFQQYGVDLRAFVTQHATSGLGATPPVIQGELTSLGTEGAALFTLASLGALSPAEAGVPAEYVTQWTVDALDRVSLGGELFWLPTRLIAGAAAHDLAPDVSMANALAAEVQCDVVGALLGGVPGCDGACLATLCHDALALRWEQARDASAASGTVGTIELQALGQAEFDDSAAITAFAGDWVGQVSDGTTLVPVTGSATGVAPVPPPP